MPESTKAEKTTPTHRLCRVIGRPGAGLDGAHGGICFYDGGKEFRCQPGDVIDIPVKAAAGYLAEGLVENVDPVEED